VFYAAAYAGFLAPAVIAAVANVVAVPTILWVVVGLGVLSWVAILVSSRKHIPA
jgi:hypothetical protein